MTELKPGVLISVTRPMGTHDPEVVAEYGPLWVLGGVAEANTSEGDGALWHARSLATGFDHLWFEVEFEVANQGEEQ